VIFFFGNAPVDAGSDNTGKVSSQLEESQFEKGLNLTKTSFKGHHFFQEEFSNTFFIYCSGTLNGCIKRFET
jgi:hypothetical protein